MITLDSLPCLLQGAPDIAGQADQQGDRMMLMRGRVIVTALMLLIAVARPGRAQAQEFPSRPISILVIYPAGGPADLMARSLAEVMRERLGQTVIVENRPGAG